MQIFYLVMQRGFIPQPNDPARMMAKIGTAHTKLMLTVGHKLTAAEALRFQLIEGVVAFRALLFTVEALVADVVWHRWHLRMESR